ncbi:MAG: SH3 domain-containing protein [Treponema sp.]|nr:SH3 domain-containing protein [Treponema sp.]
MKRIFFLCALVSAGIALSAQQGDVPSGASLAVREGSGIWASGMVVRRDDNATRRLPQGTVVLGELAGIQALINGTLNDITLIWYRNNEYSILTSDLRPIGGGQLPRSWITAGDNDQRVWAISYYLDVLQSRDRNTLINHERAWFAYASEQRTDSFYEEMVFGSSQWHDWFFISPSLVFFDAVIIMGGAIRDVGFITSITPFNAGYRITMPNRRVFAESPLPFPPWRERQSFDLIFIPDGDFMDVYLDSLDNHFASFAKVDASVLEETQNLIRHDTVDFSRITAWPRRADGSMDFPPPGGVTLAFRATHRTTARLHVRESPTTAANIVTTLDLGAEVQILETGSEETIGGITAPWVRVQSANGYTGWSFAGFLEAVQPTVPVQADLVPAIAPAASETPAASRPPVLWYMAGGGAVALLLVGVVVFLARRKT